MSALVEVLVAHSVCRRALPSNNWRICCTCGTWMLSDEWPEHVDRAIAAAGLTVIQLPAPGLTPTHWRDSCLGAWQAQADEDPVSAWTTGPHDPDAIALPNGDFMSTDAARALALALLAAVAVAETGS